MPKLYRESLAVLDDARAMLNGQVDILASARPPDSAALTRIRALAQGFKVDAHSLLVRLLFESEPSDLTDEADDVLERLAQVVSRIDYVLGAILPHSGVLPDAAGPKAAR